LNNGTTDKINITSFGEGASIFYATLKANAILDTDYTVTNGDADSTSVLVANDGANVEIANGKTLKTNTNVGLIATGGARVSGAVPVAENNGTLVSTRTDKGIGIYATYATGKNSGTITMNNKNAVGMLATIGSNLTNTNKIELKGVSSAGIYGENSNLTNSGTASKIIVNKAASAGMYAKMTGASSTAKTSKNEGEIKVIADGDGKSAAMYSRMESGSTAKLTTENTGTIEVAQTGSAGIFADNQSNGQSEVLNSGLVKMTGIKSVGIIGKKSKVTNSGTGTNGIEISGTGSAGILATDESEVINSGRIEGSTGTDLVGISVDKTSTVENSGTITMNTDSNTGIASKGGEVTNEGEITLKGIKSTGISSENGDVTNSGTGTKGIKVKNEKSVGIYAKLTGNDDKTVSNTGTISLETPTGLTPEKSAAIYSLIDSGTGKLTTENNGTINVDQKNSVGIFAQNNTRDKSKSVAKNIKTINVSKEGSAGILGEKSTITNSGAGTDGIVLTAIKTAGIIGNKDSKVSNAGRIETTGITPADATEGLVGISLNASTGTNETGGTITLGTDFSTGMYGKAASTLTNYGTITGNNKHAVGMAADASTATNETTGTITLNGVNSTGMFGESAAKLINKNTIDGNAVGAVGMAVNASTAENNNGATINLIANNSTGIFGKAASTVTNAGTIDMKTAVPSKIEEGLVGIALDASTGTNTSDGKIKIGTAYSTGMFGTAGSTATNEGSITGDKLKAVGMAGNASTVTNKHIITLDGKNSTGMFGTASSTLLNDEGATITVKEEESVGIYSKENVKLAQNKGTILTEKKKSAGMLGNEGSLENENSITTKEEESAGMYVENATAANKKTITAEGKASAGIYVKLDKAVGGTISGTNEGSNAVITMEKEGSAGMLGFVDSKVADPSAKLTLTNQNSIVINSTASAGMMVTNNAAAVPVSNVKAVNTGIIDLNSTVTKAENIGILANQRATGINEKIINVNSESSVGMSAKEGSNIENNTSSGTINLKAESGIGMLADGKDASGNISTATNNAKIIAVSTGIKSLGMLAQNHGKAENKKTIEILSQQGVGIFISETGTGKNTSDGTITLENTEAVGIFAKNNGSTYTAENAGSIVLGKADGLTNKISLIGMFGQAESGKTASIKNTGTIDINTSKSVGMYAKNDPANSVTAVDLHNAETININNAESAGIYAPKANVSKVGKINLKDSDITNGSSAVYISEGGKVSDTDTAEISLGTVNQNRVAYYVNGAGSTLAGTNIGKITGYGVGVYLQGNGSSDKAEIDGNTPTLDYKASGANGNGIIGLYLSGDTDIQAYTKGITVGDSVDTKYAIGIYSNKQGIPGIPYSITTPIQAGANGVGIYSDKDSNIKYTGDMEIGDGATAGIGIFITKKEGANGGKVELASNTIKLKGTGGVAVIASEGTVFDGKNATIELLGTNVQGVGVYAKKGSEVNVDNWHFKNYGNSAEEVRSEEGIAKITAPVKQLNPKMVLTHVINGETYIANGSKVMSVNDGSIAATSNIGLMVEGLKNPTAPAPLTWQEGNFEIANHGTIDFSIAEKSTAIFSNSARALNDGTIKVGENSTAIYGFYDENTRKYDGSTLNKLEIETSANSKISLGNGSTGMYLINAEKVENKGGEITADTGAAKNVGIYVVNGQDSNSNNNKNLTMTTAANITLGDGSVGIYSKGKSVSSKNTVTNTGNITIGNQLTAASGKSPAVAVYAENTKFDNDSKVRVGENGIAFYGKNSEITAKNSVDFSNKGVLAYLENSKFVSYLGDLDTKNTMIYAKDSDVTLLDSSMNKVKVTVHDGVTGAYIEGKSTLNGVGEIVLGEKSTGLFLKNTQPNFISSTELISGTKKEARGIISMDSNLTNNSKISLTGEDSVGIYSNANTFKTVVNNGKLTLSGKKTLGVFLRGVQSFKNTADIDIADSLNSLEPTIGIYTAEGSSSINHASGKIEVGKKSIGIYSKTDSDVEIESGKIHVKDEAIGIYKEKGKVVLKGELNVDKHTSTVVNTEPVGVYAVNGTEIDDQSSKVTIGEKSYGFILNNTDLSKTNIYRNDNSGTVTMENDSVFLYSSGKADINNKRSINGNNSDHLIGFYIKNGGDFVNEGNIDFSNGKGNIGIYAPGGKVTNKAKISVGKTDDVDSLTGKPYTDASKIVYGIGMAADNGGHIINHESGEIRVYGNKSIGMYGSGHGTVVENFGKIYLDGSRATASDKVQSMTGVYIDNGATFVNHKNGLIRTADAYAGRDGKVNKNVNGLVGVAIMNGSTLENYGNILIDAEDSYGVIIRGKRDSNGKLERYAVIKNYGNIKVVGKGAFGINWKDVSQDDINNLKAQIDAKLASDPRGQEIVQASGTDKNFEGVSIVIKNGKPVFSIGGVQIPDSEVEKIEKIMGRESNVSISDVGFYIDTLGRTKPVNFVGVAPPVNSQLIIGTEYSGITNKKQWFLTGDIIKPFLQEIQGRNFKLTTLAGSLTWIATPVLDNHGQLVGVAMKKIPYTSLVERTENSYNFTDGLEQRYDMNELTSIEKRVFVKLNSIGKNEEAVMTQAIDEMMGHQYANVQQRIFETGNLLNKEFGYLRNEWETKSKDSNKIKVFGMKGNYKTDTAGIIDYTNKAYGFAYLNENETIKLGESSGWYAGAVKNKFDFSDIGGSKEEQTMVKAGVYKSKPLGRDHNNGLNWTVAAEGFVGTGDMDRKFLVVDDIFEAKSQYRTYGLGLRNELRKNVRTSERTSISPYGSLRMEYGRFDGIKEDSGQMRLEVKSNDYYSIKPEVGVEFKYRQPMAVRTTFIAKLGLAYENELGKVGDVNNKARVRYTTADWFNIRGEKDDRRGNGKVDLNLGIENTRFGVTVNAGYDTKGENVRGGIGFRAIY
jgi:AT family autotransporter